MISALLTLLVGLFCLRSAMARLRRLAELARLSPKRIASQLRRASSAEAEALSGTVEHDAVGQLLGAPFSSPSRPAAVAEMNDALGEIDGALRERSGVPKAASRIALFFGGGAAAVELARGLGTSATSAGGWAAACFLIGVLAAAGGAAANRRASRAETEQRDGWNSVVRRLSHFLPPEGDGETPKVLG